MVLPNVLMKTMPTLIAFRRQLFFNEGSEVEDFSACDAIHENPKCIPGTPENHTILSFRHYIGVALYWFEPNHLGF